ncbi:MAG: nucleoside recognition domain-containing protein, partial [Eubacteriales bacterium]
ISAAKKHGITELISSVSELLEKTQNAFNSPAFDFPSDRKRSEFSEKLADEVTTYLQKNPHAEDRIDALICKKAVGIPLFFIIMMCVFALTFSFLGDIACLAVEKLFSGLSSTLEKILILLGTSDHISKFVVSVFESGIGAVVSFIPRIAILFALLELLEDSGYLSRAAFVMDAPMRRLGLSGKSFIPFVMGFGCTVPAVLWAKVLEKKEQKNVIFSLPFIPCGARFPVFAMITGSFFPSHRALASFIIYACGISAAFLSLLLLAKNKKAPPLSMELPKYRIPRPSNIVRVMNEKIREFISRAGSIVFLSASVIYILSAVNPSMRLAESADESILAYIAKALSPLLLPIGLSDYRVCAALISGFFAKESIVSTLSVLGVTDISSVLSLPQGISLCAFSLLYSPCAATVAACRLRLGKKDAAAVFFRSLIFAYAVSFIIYTAAVFCGL